MIITVISKASNTYHVYVYNEFNIAEDFKEAIKKPIYIGLSDFNLRTNQQKIYSNKRTLAITIEKDIQEKTGETMEQYLITQKKLYCEL